MHTNEGKIEKARNVHMLNNWLHCHFLFTSIADFAFLEKTKIM